ncbi:MAG: RNA ligase family protein [Nitrosotalea sp.]
MTGIKDMPKLESPFIRVKDKHDNYFVTPEIAMGYEWVFNDDDVLATEKLDGTNVSIVMEDGQIKSIWNRTERIPFFNKGKNFITKGVLESYIRGYTNFSDGQYFGELIGEKVQGNPYSITGNLWIPFSTYAQKHLSYKSWNKYPKTYDSISRWFEEDLFSLFMAKHRGSINGEMFRQFPEGIVFIKTSTGQMAKLRRDMFPWYKGRIHENL